MVGAESIEQGGEATASCNDASDRRHVMNDLQVRGMKGGREEGGEVGRKEGVAAALNEQHTAEDQKMG